MSSSPLLKTPENQNLEKNSKGKVMWIDALDRWLLLSSVFGTAEFLWFLQSDEN